MRFWWMKACTVMLQWSHAIWFVQNWSITPECSTFWSALAIYRSQRIWSTECPVNHMWCAMDVFVGHLQNSWSCGDGRRRC
jgi:hypothetical protein